MNEPDEIVRTPGDARKAATELPRRNRDTGRSAKAPAVWNWTQATELGGTWGQYPQGRGESFLSWLHGVLERPTAALHVCSGALGPEVWGVRLDLRASQRPDVVADGRHLPFRDGAFDAVAIDPPYSVEYARSLYGTDYPRPSHLMREAVRCVRPGGRVAFLHFIVPNPPPGSSLERVFGMQQLPGFA